MILMKERSIESLVDILAKYTWQYRAMCFQADHANHWAIMLEPRYKSYWLFQSCLWVKETAVFKYWIYMWLRSDVCTSWKPSNSTNSLNFLVVSWTEVSGDKKPYHIWYCFSAEIILYICWQDELFCGTVKIRS